VEEEEEEEKKKGTEIGGSYPRCVAPGKNQIDISIKF
jgi:hypothetical protein